MKNDKPLNTEMCNHATLPGQMHITSLVYWPQLHVSCCAGGQLAGHPRKIDSTLLKSGPFRGPQNFSTHGPLLPCMPRVAHTCFNTMQKMLIFGKRNFEVRENCY